MQELILQNNCSFYTWNDQISRVNHFAISLHKIVCKMGFQFNLSDHTFHLFWAFDLCNVSHRDMRYASNINGCFCKEHTKLFVMEVSNRLIWLIAFCTGWVVFCEMLISMLIILNKQRTQYTLVHYRLSRTRTMFTIHDWETIQRDKVVTKRDRI